MESTNVVSIADASARHIIPTQSDGEQKNRDSNRAIIQLETDRQIQCSIKHENPSNPPQQIEERTTAVHTSQQSYMSLHSRSTNPAKLTSYLIHQAKKLSWSSSDDVATSHALARKSLKRARTSISRSSGRFGQEGTNILGEAQFRRIDYWTKEGFWPTEDLQKDILHLTQQDQVQRILAGKTTVCQLCHRRSELSLNGNISSIPPIIPSDQKQRVEKSTPYTHVQYEQQLGDRGSFMGSYYGGVAIQSEVICKILLGMPQSPPQHTRFSDHNLFSKTIESLRLENEPKVIYYIAQLIVPPAEELAIRGAKHLEVLRETINAGWNNAVPFYGPHPQPDYGLGFKRESFTREQLRKLDPFIGRGDQDKSYIAATYNMYFPFLTSEVKCGLTALIVADRQNAHSQTVALRNLVELFRLVGRENELHQEINGFSISHSNETVRIWGHYAVIVGNETTFYRHPIANFQISYTPQADTRWVAYTFVRNIYDLWVPRHFKRICSVIDMIPSDLNFEVSELSEYSSDRFPKQI